jgi:hypothetical protein
MEFLKSIFVSGHKSQGLDLEEKCLRKRLDGMLSNSIRNAPEDAMNKKAGLWVDVRNRLMVLFADEVVRDGVALRGMHHTMPISDEHLAHFHDVPEPTLIEFE